ncbi:MAG: ABC transporter permease [Vicinamibacterales bacterium]
MVTLALGIGAATAAYSAMYALVLRPRGFESDGLIGVKYAIAANAPAPVSFRDYRQVEARQQALASLAAWVNVPSVTIASGDRSEFVQLEAVTGSYFDTLRVQPAAGRLIQPADDEPGAEGVIVLADWAWRQLFDADPAIVGRTVRIAQRPVQVVGVAPAGFRGADTLLVTQYAGWVPLSFVPSIRDQRPLRVAGRLAPGRGVDSAGAELEAIGRRLDAEDPLPPASLAGGASRPRTRSWSAVAFDDSIGVASASEGGRIVMALPLLVLLVACTNLTNLVVSRGTARRQELAIRGALGGSRWRLIRDELGETVVLAGTGGFLGALVTHGLLTWTVATLREPLAPYLPMTRIEWRLEPVVFVAAGGAALLAMVVAGLLPAWQMTRAGRLPGLTTDPLGALPRWRGRSNLIALQVGVSVALFLLTVIAVRFIVVPPNRSPLGDLGRGLERIVVASVPLTAQQLDEPRARETLDRIVRSARAMPGLEDVALASEIPGLGFVGGRSGAFIAPAGEALVTKSRPGVETSPSAPLVSVTPEFFDLLHLRPAAGRLLSDDDRAGSRTAMVVNARLAERLFGQAAAVGRVVRLERQVRDPVAEEAVVVGVLAASDLDSDQDRQGVAYVPFAQQYAPTMIVLGRSASADSRPMVGALTSAIRRVDPGLAVLISGRADVMAAGPFAFLRFLATVCGGLATLALVLAMGGLYGVLSHVVAHRNREMGIRIALGAEPRRIVRMILRNGFRPVVEGLFIGVASAWVIRQILQLGFTATLSSLDVTMVALAVLPLIAAASIAAYLPARRASRVDPNVALRDL